MVVPLQSGRPEAYDAIEYELEKIDVLSQTLGLVHSADANREEDWLVIAGGLLQGEMDENLSSNKVLIPT